MARAKWTVSLLVVSGLVSRTGEAAPLADEDRSFAGIGVDVEALTTRVRTRRLAVDRQGLRVASADVASSGHAYGLGAHFRVLGLEIGPRLRSQTLDGASLTSVGAEVGLSTMLRLIAVRASLGGGTMRLAEEGSSDPGQASANGSGYYARALCAVSVRAGRFITLGGVVSYELFAVVPPQANALDAGSFVGRPSVEVADRAWMELERFAGTGYGTTLAFGLGAGLGF
jgi:hypothetical protein